jgi:hypothetical protein
MSLTKKQKDMLHFIKCTYLSRNLQDFAASLYPKEMEADKFSYGNFGNRIKFLIYYSPLAGRNSKSRKRAWKTLVALQDKGYIVGFYIDRNLRLKRLGSGVGEAETWTYWESLSTLSEGYYEEIDSGDVIVYLTPKGLKANTEINDWSGTAHIQGKIVNLLKKDGRLGTFTKYDIGGNPTKDPHLVDDLTRLVHADSEKDWIPLMEDWGVINKTDLIQLSILEAKLKIELKIERKKKWDERYKRN